MYCEIKIKNYKYKCFYITNDKLDKKPLLLLHGWGVDSQTFAEIIDKLDNFVVCIDFIGFGKSDIPLEPFTLEDYVSQVNQVITLLKLENVTLLGHSFGGRVATKYNYYYGSKKLILVDSAGIKNKSLSLTYKILKYKLLKKMYSLINKPKYYELINNSGSRDYKALQPIMKKTMSNILKEDVKKYCKITRTKVFLLWGINDMETPLINAHIFQELFYDSKLVLFYNSCHFPYLDEKEKFIRVINYVTNG